jgi:hypothetical protein
MTENAKTNNSHLVASRGVNKTSLMATPVKNLLAETQGGLEATISIGQAVLIQRVHFTKFSKFTPFLMSHVRGENYAELIVID